MAEGKLKWIILRLHAQITRSCVLYNLVKALTGAISKNGKREGRGAMFNNTNGGTNYFRIGI